MTCGAMVRRAFEILRQHGLRVLWIKLLGELGYRRVVLLERSLDDSLTLPPSRLPVTVRPLRKAEVEEYAAFYPGADPEEIHRRLDAGHRCFTVRYGGQLIHAGWVGTGRVWIEYLRRHWDLASDEAYLYEAFTAPRYRNLRVGTARVTEETRVLAGEGYHRVIAVVSPENLPAVRYAATKGGRPVGVIGYVKLGPWRHEFTRLDPTEPLAARTATRYWDRLHRHLQDRPRYLDAFLGALKRAAYLDLIEAWGGAPRGGRVLKTDLFEEAMGTADAFALDLCHSGTTVIGMDLSPAAVARARARNGTRLGHVAGDSRHLPFKDDSFALVVSPSTLDHFPDASDLHRSLREIARILAPGGRLIVTLDNRQNVFDPLLRLAIRLRRVPFYVGRSYTVRELRAELEAAGFTVEDTSAIVHHPRLMAVAAVTVANRLGWQPLVRAVQRALIAAQRFNTTRWRYYTGCFVAAKAVPRKPSGRETV
ncbi:MAG: GNAT family N-acetyltransferase [Candidatus Binatia bacterium]